MNVKSKSKHFFEYRDFRICGTDKTCDYSEENMRLTWLNDGFICKDLYAPFTVEKDTDYITDLAERYSLLLNQAINAGADTDSVLIIKKYRMKIIEALKCYYCADIGKCNTIIRNLLRDIGEHPFAISALNSSYAFPGEIGSELQLFRCRIGNPANAFSAKEMLHLPRSLRAKSGNYRFSIPGNPSLYLSNSSYGCWIETGFPSDNEFNVSPILLDGTQKVLNLVLSVRDFTRLNEFEGERVHIWLKLLMIVIATSYRINETNRTFKSEYIISQAVMMACKKMGYDGVAYYSKRVYDEVFARCAINLSIFVNYKKEYSDIVNHIKIDDTFNYAVYKNLLPSLKYKQYELRTVRTGFINNIGSYDRQYPYRETDFYNFDQFLFTTWRDKPNGKAKEVIPWGMLLD